MFDTNDTDDTNRDQFHHETNAADPDYSNDGFADNRENHEHDNKDRFNRRHSRKEKRASMKYNVIPTIAASILAACLCLGYSITAVAKAATRTDAKNLGTDALSTLDITDRPDSNFTFADDSALNRRSDPSYDNDWRFGSDDPFFFDGDDDNGREDDTRKDNRAFDPSFQRLDESAYASGEDLRLVDPAKVLDDSAFNSDDLTFDGADGGYRSDNGEGDYCTFDQNNRDDSQNLNCNLDRTRDRFFFDKKDIDS